MEKKQGSAVIFLLGFILLIGIGIGGYYIGSNYQILPKNPDSSLIPQPSKSISLFEDTETKPVQNEPLFAGTIKKLDEDLKLFKFNEDEIKSEMDKTVVYYEAGIFSRGKWAGYTRILAIRLPEGPGDSLIFTLATKDRATYVLDDPDNFTKILPVEDWENPMRYLNEAKVTVVDVFETEHPKALKLTDQFALYRESIPTNAVETTKKDSYNQNIYETQVQSKDGLQPLVSTVTNLNMYYRPRKPNELIQQMEAQMKEMETLRNQYLATTTEVVIFDSAQLPVSYTMTTKSAAEKYTSDKQVYDGKYKTYVEQIKLFDEKKISTMPDYPQSPLNPNFRFTKSSFSTAKSIFDTYDMAFPHACGMDVYMPIVTGITVSDLEKIGDMGTIPVYALKNSDHPLLRLAYQNKIARIDNSEFGEVNKGKLKPTLEQYIEKNPILFIQDNWKRWVALGEYDYQLIGGCGKPVVYLYPPKPTQVRVTMLSPIVFETQIPVYENGWNIMAYPDGTLKDLQTQYTDCSKLRYAKQGSEYAYDACTNNRYPYIYWSGTRQGKAYPDTDTGWVVEQAKLESFFNKTLEKIGFTLQEKNDFISFWIPEIEKKKAPYYKISFMQTQELNSFIPMRIEPEPDRVYRFFVDATPLEKPVQIKAPNLQTIVRSGFTVIEWGGKK